MTATIALNVENAFLANNFRVRIRFSQQPISEIYHLKSTYVLEKYYEVQPYYSYRAFSKKKTEYRRYRKQSSQRVAKYKLL